MNPLRLICAAFALSFTLSVSAFAGHIDTTGAPAPDPAPTPTASTTTTTTGTNASILITILNLIYVP